MDDPNGMVPSAWVRGTGNTYSDATIRNPQSVGVLIDGEGNTVRNVSVICDSPDPAWLAGDLHRVEIAKGRSPELEGARPIYVAEAARELLRAEEQDRLTVLRGSRLGNFLSEGGFVGWATLALMLISIWQA